MPDPMWVQEMSVYLVGVGVHPLDAANILAFIWENYDDVNDMPDSRNDVFVVTNEMITDARIAWYASLSIPDRIKPVIDALPVQSQVAFAESAYPVYTYDLFRDVFINVETGDEITRDELVGVMDNDIQQVEGIMSNLTGLLASGIIPALVWYYVVDTYLQRQGIQYGILGAGGWRFLDNNGLGAIQKNLISNSGYLRGFVADLRNKRYVGKDGKPMFDGIMQRLRLYGGSARRLFWKLWKGPLTPPNDVVIERRLLRPAEHCVDCVAYYSEGWQLQGMLPNPGEGSVCFSNCRCVIIRKVIPQSEVNAWIGTLR